MAARLAEARGVFAVAAPIVVVVEPVGAGAGRGGTFGRPTDVAFDTQGNIFVADGYGSNYIHRYDKDGKWLKTFGGTGDALLGKPLQHITNFRVQACSHQRIKRPAGFHAPLDVRPEAVLSVRPLPGVYMLLVLGHQCGGS